MGSKNNLVSVKMSDFEVFQALAKDSEGIHSSAQTEYSQVLYHTNIINGKVCECMFVQAQNNS